MPTQLDPGQVAKGSYDEPNQAIRVNVVATSTGGGTPTPILSGDSSGNEATVNSSGELLVHATLAVESIEIGKVDQGAAGVAAWLVDGSAVTQPVSAASLPLPTGAATSSLQTTGNTSVASIDTKTPALGQALSAGSVPVVLPATQITALTPPTTVTVTQATGTNLHVVIDSGTVAATQSGTWTVSDTSQGSVTGGTAGTTSELAGGVFHTALPTLTNGQQASLALDTSGRLLVSAVQTTTPWTVSDTANVSATGSTSTVATQVAGRFNTSLPTLTTTQGAPLQLDSSARLIVAPLTNSSVVTSQNQDGSGNALTSTAGALDVNLKTSAISVTTTDNGYTAVNHARIDYSVSNVTTAAYTTVIASTGSAQEVEIFDSNGFTMLLAFGAAASEVDQIYVVPGGNGRIKLKVPASTRISIKAVVQTANVGEFTINLYG